MSDTYSKIGVIGAGAMGRGIAQVFAQAGADVVLLDQSQQALDDGLAAVRSGLERQVAKGRMTAEAADGVMARISPSQATSALVGCDLVVEAIVERLDIKVQVLSEVAQVAPKAVLASNTSSLRISDISDGVSAGATVVGLHFFNPAQVMKLVEVVALPETPQSVTDRLVATMKDAGKHPVVCADTPGFIVNRCARPFYGEALAILEENTHSAAEIDAAMTAAGYRIGPFALIDLIGADVHLAATEGVAAGFDNHPRYHVFDALKAQVAAGHFGRKSGQGFVTPAVKAAPPEDAGQIVRRIEVMLVNEARTLLADGGVTRADVDTALKLGLNFPRGPFEIAEKMQDGDVFATLADLRARAPVHLKRRYAPAPASTTEAI